MTSTSPQLEDWRDSPEIASAVGSAVYTTTVNVPSAWLGAGHDVRLDLCAFAGAAHPYVNGKLVTAQTTPGGIHDIGALLHAGPNQIEVTLDTTLSNENAALAAAGNLAYGTGPTPLTPAPSGPLGPVTLTPIDVAHYRLGVKRASQLARFSKGAVSRVKITTLPPRVRKYEVRWPGATPAAARPSGQDDSCFHSCSSLDPRRLICSPICGLAQPIYRTPAEVWHMAKRPSAGDRPGVPLIANPTAGRQATRRARSNRGTVGSATGPRIAGGVAGGARPRATRRAPDEGCISVVVCGRSRPRGRCCVHLGGRQMPGPLQVIAMSFGPGSDFRGRVLAEVDRLQGRGVLRLLDLLFVSKREDGTIERTVIGDDDFGALLSRIVPLGGAGLVEREAGDLSGFDPTDAVALAHSLLPGTALAFLLVEHGWAQPLFDAIAETGGELVGEGFLTAEALLMVGAEVAAMEEAVEVIAAAQAAEADATLRAIQAETRAADAVAASEAIRAAAAVDAVRALIRAGIVEEEAAHEAIEALGAADLIIAAADEAAAKAVAEDQAAVQAADEAAAQAVAQDAAEVLVADEAAAEAIAEDQAAVQAADEAAAEAVAEGETTTVAADQAAADAVAEAAATLSAASITLAEARILRYLPTPLTFALIADKLGISRSAAKDRAGRLYQKLGVHSRAEAVIRARALGLID